MEKKAIPGRKAPMNGTGLDGQTSGVTRRALLEWLGAGAVVALGGSLVESLAAAERAGGNLAFRPGEGRGGVFDAWPVRTVDPQDLSLILASWRLAVGGLVERPATYTFADLLALPRTDQTADFHCVEGWSVPGVPWNGVRIGELLDRAGPLPDARYLHLRTLGDTYNDSVPLAVAREPRSLLAFGVVGSTLPLEHGFPLRVVVPRLLGYKNAKYVHRLELAAEPLHGYWVKAGYPYGGEVPPERLRPPGPRPPTPDPRPPTPDP
ncbi:MAG: molybdopterin-dependent oxidoreductase [Deferrisomatales bacterium]